MPWPPGRWSAVSAAFDILLTHRYSSQGGAPAICVGADGLPTACRWKASRRRGANGYGIQHLEHLADLIDAAYAEPIAHAEQLQALGDWLDDHEDSASVQVRSFVREIHQILREAVGAS